MTQWPMVVDMQHLTYFISIRHTLYYKVCINQQ